MKIDRVGVDIGKNYFHACAVTRQGNVVWRKMFKRAVFVNQLARILETDVDIGMEACGGAHFWARTFGQLGFKVKLIAPQFVKPYVQSNKTDHADAEAIAEAMDRPKMRFVSVKSVAQQDMQSMHRIRDELVKQRTAKVNQIRGLLAEYGLVAPTGVHQLRRAIPCWLEDAANGLSFLVRQFLCELRNDLVYLDERIEELNQHVKRASREDENATRLLQLQGIGPINATALSAALGDGSAFRNGRDFAVSLGLTPRQQSTGGRERLLGISKRGDAYLRKQLVHGARTVVKNAAHKNDPLSQWINRLMARRHTNVVTIALAAKIARMAWALVRYKSDYEPTKASIT